MSRIINNNLELYKPSRSDWLKSIEYCGKLNNRNDKKLVFHCLWRVPLDFSRKQVAVLKSIIVNHDISNIEINLWSNVDLSGNEYFKQVSKYVNLKLWNIQEEVKGTILEGYSVLSDINDNLCYLESDLFRLLVLHKYGGFYIDMDVLVLRDMSPLNSFEFLYQWGTSGFSSHEPHITMNGAIMRLEKKSKLSKEFLEKILITKPVVNTTAWGNQLYSKIEDNDLLVLPCIWFNSEWGFDGTRCNPFKNIGPVELFNGAFTWHWHNKWNDEVEVGSKFQILEEIHNQKFKAQLSHKP
jgi:hypothetical protein